MAIRSGHSLRLGSRLGYLGTRRAGTPRSISNAVRQGGITRNDLTRRTQFIRKSLRDEYVADLVESGELVVKFGANGGEVYFPGS